ncbi:MAG: DUF2948 family protein [Alphaproteobacteria bacterium]|nr:DUF2948 family protein [Alphaproteobacteria bacterium]
MSDRVLEKDHSPLKLVAEDAEDLAILAACLQDAVVLRRDMPYVPKQYRFAAIFNRFRWEEGAAGSGRKAKRPRSGQQVRTGMHFDGVTSVRARQTEGDDSAVFDLPTIDVKSLADSAAEITLLFAGVGEIKLDVECIDCSLADLTPPWSVRRRPDHPIDDHEAKA